MFVLVSMATDEMIRLVSMYPEVWFMDTTAGESMIFFMNMNFFKCIHILHEFISTMNSYLSLS
jgi:hypothetical protein